MIEEVVQELEPGWNRTVGFERMALTAATNGTANSRPSKLSSTFAALKSRIKPNAICELDILF